MKYVLFKQKGTNLIHPVLIADHTNHIDVDIVGSDPVSTGFVKIEKGIVTTYGRSDSLNLDSSPADKIYIVALLNNFGVYGFTIE